jgi:hypothetical protein
LAQESSRRRFPRYVHVKNWNLLFYCSNIVKSENAMLWRMLSRLETCIVYCCIWSVTLAKSIVPRKTWGNLWHSYILSCSWQRCKLNFQYFFISQLYFHNTRYVLKEERRTLVLLPKLKVEFRHLFSLQKRFSLCSSHKINANIVVFCWLTGLQWNNTRF